MRQPNDLATLLFSLFVYMSDADGDITPQEVQTLNNLIDDPGWMTSERLRHAVEVMRTDYADVWSDYDSGRMTVSRQTLSDGLAACFHRLRDDEAAMLHADLEEYVRRLVRRSGAVSLSRLGQSPLSEGRQRARRDIDGLLQERAPEAKEAAHSSVDKAGVKRSQHQKPPQDEAKFTSSSVHEAEIAAHAQDASATTWMRSALDPLAALELPTGRMRVRCIRVVQETSDVKTYVLAPVLQQAFRYKPGQFVTLELPVDGGRTLRRSYTISSSPSRPLTLSVTVKRLHMGWASTWLYEKMVPGVEIDVLGPSGDFTCVDHPAEKLLFASAGSGVTPVMSMLRYLADIAAPVDIVFINNVRSPADIIFRHELLHLQAQVGLSLKLHIVPARMESGHGWNGLTGRLDARMIQYLVPDLAERETFACGPSPYMTALRQAFADLEYPMQRFHSESFGGSVAPASPARAPGTAVPAALPVAKAAPMEPPQRLPPPVARDCEIVFSRSGRTVTCSQQDRILDVALDSGIAIDHACRSGACGTCRITRFSGDVTMGQQNALSQDAVDAGDILACVSTVRGRVEVDA